MKSFVSKMFAGALMALSLVVGSATAEAQESIWQRVNDTRTLRLGVAPYAPFSYKDPIGTAPGGLKQGNDTWRGISVRMGMNLAEALGAEVEIVELTWASAIAAIQNGQVDLFFGLDGTPQRAAAVEFVHQPVYRYAFVFYGKDEVKADSWTDLDTADITIGLVVGTNFETVLAEFAPNATVKRFQSSSEVMAAFQTGQIDGTITTPASADLSRAKLKSGKVSLIDGPAIYLPILATIPRESDQRWRHFLETSLQYMSDTGTTRRLYRDELTAAGVPAEQVSTLFIQ